MYPRWLIPTLFFVLVVGVVDSIKSTASGIVFSAERSAPSRFLDVIVLDPSHHIDLTIAAFENVVAFPYPELLVALKQHGKGRSGRDDHVTRFDPVFRFIGTLHRQWHVRPESLAKVFCDASLGAADIRDIALPADQVVRRENRIGIPSHLSRAHHNVTDAQFWPPIGDELQSGQAVLLASEISLTASQEHLFLGKIRSLFCLIQ